VSLDLAQQDDDALLYWIGPNGRILDVSDAVCALLGYDRHAMRDLSLWDINRDFKPSQWPDHWASLRRARRLRFDSTYHRRDGSSCAVEVIAHYVDIGGQEHICAIAYPLTAPRKTNMELRESEARLALALDVSGQALFELNLITGQVFLSKALALLLGVGDAERVVDLETWQSWVHPEDRDRISHLHEECVTGQRTELFTDFRHQHGAGHWIWIRSIARVVQWDEVGRPARVLGTHMDVTARKDTEEQLELAQISIDRASFGIFWIVRDGRITYVNQEACRSLGYTKNELVGSTISKIDMDYSQEDHEKGWKTFSEGAVFLLERTHTRKDGTSFPVEITGNCAIVGEKEYHFAFVQNISERKRAEEAIQASEAFLESVIDQNPLPLIIYDPTGAMVRINAAALTLFQVTDDPTALSDFNLFADDRVHSTGQLDLIRRVLSDGITIRCTHRFELRRPGAGTVLDLDSTVFPIRSVGGEITHVAITHLDITDLKATEAKLRHHLDSEQALSDISALMIKPGWDDIDARLDWMLQRIGEMAQADRAFLFSVSPDGRTATNTHEWCAPGIVPQRQNLQDLPTADYAPFYDRMRNGKVVRAHAKVSDGQQHFKPTFLEPGPHSLICIPVMGRSQLLGFLGLDVLKRRRFWSDIDIRFLRLVTEMVAHTWQHIKSYQAQRDHTRFLESLDRISRVLTRSERDVDMLANLTRELLDIFQADRAYLLHPCDPDAETVHVTVETSRPKSGDASLSARTVEPNDSLRSLFQQVLASTGPVMTTSEPESEDFRQYGARSRMVIALRPQQSPHLWQLGLHQCNAPRNWTESEQRLFQSIAERIEEALSGYILLQKLTESESRHRAVFDNSLDALIIHTPDGQVLAVNEAMMDMYGLNEAESLACTVPDISGPEYQEVDFKDLWARVSSGQMTRFEWMAQRPKDGHVFPVEVMLRCIPYGDQQVILANIRDMTERKQAEESLRQSEERFAKAFRASPAAIALTSLNTRRVIDVNDQWMRDTGFAREEVIGRRPDEFGLLIDREVHEQARAEIVRTGVLRNHAIRVRRKDGELRDNLWSADTISLEGELVLLSHIQDVTDRKRAEEALRQSEERFAKAFRASPAAMLISTIEEGRIIDANDRWLSLFETTRENLINRTTTDTGLWAATADRATTVAPLRRKGSVRDIPILFYTRTGKPRDILWSAEIITLGDESVVLSSIYDLTEQKRVERALRESEARLSTAIESIPFDFFLLDVDGRYVLQNSASRARWGTVIGQRPTDATVYQGRAEQWDTRLERILAGEVLDAELEVTANGDTLFFRNLLAPIQDSGVVRGIVELSMDVTAQKHAESELETYREHLEDLVSERTAALQHAMSQLMQAEKLASLGNLVAGLAHELNTPLGNARMVSSTLGEHFKELSAAVAAGTLGRAQLMTFIDHGTEAVDLLERNTVRAADLISHVKEVAIDQTSVRRRTFNLKKTVEEVLATMRPTLKRVDHRIEVDVPSDLELDSFPGPLEQIITNLISNAVIHGFSGPQPGLIRIHARSLDPETVRLIHSDNGVGIPPDVQARIFDPFFTTRLGQGGSGLGLYIVYSLVTGVLGGQIEVESDPGGRGTTFNLTLPRRAPERQPDDRAGA